MDKGHMVDEGHAMDKRCDVDKWCGQAMRGSMDEGMSK